MDDNLKKSYLAIPKSNCGAISAERFTYQRYWAIREAFELYNSGEDFYIIFEGTEDIDIIKNGSINFYQVKTNEKNLCYTLTTMVRKKPDTGKSIISKLSEKESFENVKSLNLVSNLPLEAKNKDSSFSYNDSIICFATLNDDFKKKISDNIFEINGTVPDLSKYYFIYSNLAIPNMRETMVGITSIFLKDKKTTDERTSMFFDFIDIDTKNKMERTTYTDIFIEKSISKEYFDDLLTKYDHTSNVTVSKCQEIIGLYDVIRQSRLNRCLLRMNKESFGSVIIKNNIKIVHGYIHNNVDRFVGKTPKEMCDVIFNSVVLDGDISVDDKLCYVIVAVSIYLNGGIQDE